MLQRKYWFVKSQTSEILGGFLVLSRCHAPVGARHKFVWNLGGGRLVRHVELSFVFTIISLSTSELKKKSCNNFKSVAQNSQIFLLGFHGQDALPLHSACGVWTGGMEAQRDAWSWQRRLEEWTGKGQTVEAGKKPKADLQLVHFALCWRAGRSRSGCPRTGSQGGFWGHCLKAAGRSSLLAFLLLGLEAEMAYPAWSRWIKHLYGRDSWRMCGVVARLALRLWLWTCKVRSVCVTRVHVRVTRRSARYKGARAWLGIVWEQQHSSLFSGNFHIQHIHVTAWQRATILCAQFNRGTNEPRRFFFYFSDTSCDCGFQS